MNSLTIKHSQSVCGFAFRGVQTFHARDPMEKKIYTVLGHEAFEF